MKRLLLTLGVVLAMQGCAFMGKSDDATSATMDRGEAVSILLAEIEEIGYERQRVVPGIDGFINSVASLLERQETVMQEYRTVTDNHRDVRGFLSFHSDKIDDPAALQAAIDEFDANAESENEKMGPKLNDYKSATKGISEANTKMGVEIGVELATSSVILAKYSKEVAQQSALSFLSKNDEPNVGSALVRAKDQLSLANKANELIDMDKKTIEAIENLEKELQAK